jgi:hypothetical protein
MKGPEMKILLLVLGGAWFSVALLFVLAFCAAARKRVTTFERTSVNPETAKSLPNADLPATDSVPVGRQSAREELAGV